MKTLIVGSVLAVRGVSGGKHLLNLSMPLLLPSSRRRRNGSGGILTLSPPRQERKIHANCKHWSLFLLLCLLGITVVAFPMRAFGVTADPTTPGTLTAGIQEASNIAGAGGKVDISPGRWSIFTPIVLSEGQTLSGSGVSSTTLERNFGGTSPLLSSTVGGATSVVSFERLRFTVATGVIITGGAWIRLQGYAGAFIRDIEFTGGVDGIEAVNIARGSISSIHGLAFAGSAIRGTGSGLVIDNIIFSSSASNAIGLDGRTGLMHVSNFNIQLVGSNTNCIILQPSLGQSFTESVFTNGILDSCMFGIRTVGAGNVAGLHFSNLRIALGGTAGIPITLGSDNQSELTFTAIRIPGCQMLNGCIQIIGGADMRFTGIEISDPVASSGLVQGMNIGMIRPSQGILVTSSRIGYANTGLPSPNMGVAISSNALNTRIAVVGNQLAGMLATVQGTAFVSGNQEQ